MLINRKVLSLPPYVSTSWDRVAALSVQGNTLKVSLTDGSVVAVPDLSSETVERIFAAHALYLEERGDLLQKGEITGQNIEIPFQLSFGNGIGMASLTGLLQHDPACSDSPILPSEILERITGMAQFVGLNEIAQLSKPEPHCQCPHCQIMRALQGNVPATQPTPLRPKEKQWLVQELDENLYLVTNSEDKGEVYKVYLGDGQVGCNCGIHGCEHILAVLRS